ncbi:hypothetical protein GRAN_2058 [Granulicella sibirica]|uniref:Uncharacterized protein n=1 Tax=Granulicella sibirica TaxID=2479048 RepID=A0A4Q0T9F5_9BACT|nr:hypothetical protein GRAN_2058 [Granulicella sibirica]
MPKFPSTTPGFKNKHGQVVMASTGFPSESFAGQTVYRMHCSHCGHDYGSNGCDIHLRRCPRHQDGAKGEALREPSLSLFS